MVVIWLTLCLGLALYRSTTKVAVSVLAPKLIIIAVSTWFCFRCKRQRHVRFSYGRNQKRFRSLLTKTWHTSVLAWIVTAWAGWTWKCLVMCLDSAALFRFCCPSHFLSRLVPFINARLVNSCQLLILYLPIVWHDNSQWLGPLPVSNTTPGISN